MCECGGDLVECICSDRCCVYCGCRNAEPSPAYCYIDDCHQPASLVIPSYPDTIRLCAGHAHLHTPEPWEKR